MKEAVRRLWSSERRKIQKRKGREEVRNKSGGTSSLKGRRERRRKQEKERVVRTRIRKR